MQTVATCSRNIALHLHDSTVIGLSQATQITSEILHECKHRWHTHFVDNLLQALLLHTQSPLSSPLGPLHACSTEVQQARQAWAHMHSYLSLIQFFEINSALLTKVFIRPHPLRCKDRA